MKILFTDLDGTLLNDEKQIPRSKFHCHTKDTSKGKCCCDSHSHFLHEKFVDRLATTRRVLLHPLWWHDL